LHTNGYSLARKLLFEVARYNVDTELPELGSTVAEALLQPHLSYLKTLSPLIEARIIKGLAHITGGGLTDNIPRILPEGTAVTIRKDSWPVLPIFGLLQRIGNVSEGEMYRTFNMGVGMVIVCASENVSRIVNHVGECYEIGRVAEGPRTVVIA